MRRKYDRDRLRAILTIHQQRGNGGGCSCGWNHLGKSFAAHVVREYEDPGPACDWCDDAPESAHLCVKCGQWG